ncbi:MAG: 23S rRNA (guanosine(2251)-2'-O)-methyltransferase RlmB [Clostridiaceae bacterium]|nr:23S rRNA (guanosine(2251)-2'-O)-methyltransferase RlmB [Bacillota bacterium]NLN51888.1 23S rRNA (guanosine(2251)-2'-O)-methyltransferase RlmB [Clostridiaceae bacterium]
MSIENKYLDQIEGRNPVSEALKAGRSINKIWTTKTKQRRDQRLHDLLNECRAKGVIIMEVERSVLDSMAESSGHQGIIAQVAPKNYIDPFTYLEELADQGKQPFILLLDNLQDGYNFGSILRIAEAAGVDLIVIPERRSVSLDAHVAKASAGAVEFVPIARVTNLGTFIDQIKEQNFWIYGTEVEQAENYQKVDYSGSIALVIGNEAKGMSQNIKKRCDFLVTIPMQGKINSLNAAVATGIIVFQAIEQRKSKS